MQRRLNPQLFEQNTPQNLDERAHFSAVASKKMEEELRGTKKALSRTESQVEALRGQLSQVVSQYDKKINRLSKALADMENQQRDSGLKLSQKTRQLEEQMRERKIIDGKIEIMVDRYNNSLQQFENRLAALQKVISEKEMTLMKYNSAIELIFKEIEKMKAKKV